MGIGAVGTCWGSYFVEHVSAEDPIVKVGFSAHPSHAPKMEDFGESEADIYQSIQDNGNIQYFGNTPDIGNSTRPGVLQTAFLNRFSLENLMTHVSTVSSIVGT